MHNNNELCSQRVGINDYLDPLVSVCIPAYDVDQYISETLKAFIGQTYKRIELIIVDDGSNDDTIKIVQQFKDLRIKLIKTSNNGASSARNLGYQHATGSYIIFFDADDYVTSDFIESQVKAIQNQDDIVVVANWGRFHQNDINSVKVVGVPPQSMTFREWIITYWYKCYPMTNPGRVIIPRVLLEKAGLWNEALTLCDDLEFFSRVFNAARLIDFNIGALLYYRSGINGLSGSIDYRARRSLYDSVMASTKIALSTYGDDLLVKKCCANMLQSVIYELYPKQRDLIKLARTMIKDLGGADLPAPAGGYTKILINLVGWQAAKRIKTAFTRH